MANEQYQPISVNTGSSQQAIQSTPNVTPALEDLMQGIASGMISLGDLQKRNANIPLETAQRDAELTDLKTLRPLQREAQTAQLENLRAKQAFEAESLPILNDIKRAQLKQQFEDVKQHGVPSAVLDLFTKVVPQFTTFDVDKLHDPKTGMMNTAYALEKIQEAIQKAEKLKKFSALKPTAIKNVSKTGEETTFEQMIDPVSGEALGAKIPTGTKEVNVAEVAAKDRAAMAGLSNDVLKERNSSDIVKAFQPQARSFDAIDEIRNRKTPPKNADDLAILYQFIRILDPTSVVRESEKKFAESTAPGAQAFWNKVQGLWSDSNRTMDADTRANLYAAIDTLKSGAEKSVIPELKRISLLAQDRGVPLGQAFTETELKLLVNGPTPTPVAGTASAAPVSTVPGAPAAAAPAPAPAPAPGTPDIPTVQTPAEASGLPAHIQFFKTPTGAVKVNPNYIP